MKTTIESKDGNPAGSVDRFVRPLRVSEEMLKFARSDDLWHFAANLNAMLNNGYCPKCGLVPDGCVNEGCGVEAWSWRVRNKRTNSTFTYNSIMGKPVTKGHVAKSPHVLAMLNGDPCDIFLPNAVSELPTERK